MMPPQVTMLPTFLIMAKFPMMGGNSLFGAGGTGMINTYAGLVIPLVAGSFGVFLCKQFYENFPRSLDEAAEIDGANIFQRFIKIDLPMLASQMKLTVTLAIINAVQVFDTVYILTKGGPGTATITPSVVLYEQGFTYRKMGYASAIGVIMFAIIMVLTVINQKLMKNTESMD